MSIPFLAVIGGGTMARAIIEGACRAGVLDPGRVVIAEPDQGRRAVFRRAVPGAGAALDILDEEEDLPGSGQVLLAVKPQSLGAVTSEVRPWLTLDGRERVVMSILAGVTSARIVESLGPCRVVRLMPNTPASVGLGVTALSLGLGASNADGDCARRIFGAVGEVFETREEMMDAFTALAGSGPAYLYALAEAMTGAGVRMGLDQATAARAVRQTLLGGATLLARAADPPQALRAGVTSKGGTTAAAIGVLERQGFWKLVEEAMLAARDRGAELSALA
ncbi:MAG: pyrroline-5-carboxylate reductase [Phycisphaerales bacterium]|nr:pyrroline-5-carboxylate reductase [Phycisphaerales bacterium]